MDKTPSKQLGNLLGKWFEKNIYFTGDCQALSQPLCELSGDQLHQIRSILLETQNLNAYAKVVSYHMSILKSQKDHRQIESLRHLSRLEKFKLYTGKLGALEVIQNGMFSRFKFAYGHKYPLADFQFLSIGIANHLEDISLQKCIHLAEQMHGFHTKHYHAIYSQSLAPNVQYSRILHSSLSRNPDNQTLLDEYNSLMKSINTQQLRESKPVKKSSGQRNRKIPEYITPKFGTLPINIILQSICLQVSNGTYCSQTPPHELAFRFLYFMRRSRDMHPNQETLSLLIHLFHMSQDETLKAGIPSLIENFRRRCPINEKVIAHLARLGYDRCGNNKITSLHE